MTVPFHLPLGEPGLVDDVAAAAAYRAQVISSEWAFGGDQVYTAFQSSGGPLPDAYRAIVAPSAGVAWFDPETHLVRLQLMASTIRFLRDALPPGVPAPQRLIFGPVEWPHGAVASQVVEGGDVIGTLRGPMFVLRAQCQDEFHLDPLHLFQALAEMDLWQLPAGVRCPLLPAARIEGPFALAGPELVAVGAPYFSIGGGSFDVVIHNPPPLVPPERLSLLSNDTLTVRMHNLPAGANAALRFTDISPHTQHTQPNPDPVDLPQSRDWTIVPERLRQPTHAPYKTTPVGESQRAAEGFGSLQPSLPLGWRLRVTLDSGAVLSTAVSQDARDVIRQEYVFHRAPYQASSDLPVPERDLLTPNVAPPFARYFSPSDFYKHNYGVGAGGWMLNTYEAYRVAETMRRLFAEQLALRKVAGTLLEEVPSYGINVNSAWRNPERNERPSKVINSNHQLGRALDLRSTHNPSGSPLPLRAKLHHAMFHAGGEFLRALVAANGAARCRSVEILLEQYSAALWVYVAQADGTVVSRAGGEYAETVGSAPPADAETGIARAAEFASHVHIGWKPREADRPLTLPELPPYYDIAPSPGNVWRNLILIADEHPTVPADDQMPLNHIAESLKLALEAADPGVPTDIHVVGNAVAFLERLNAFRDPAFKVRRLYSFSHAWPGGLTLTHHDEATVPYLRSPGSVGAQIHDPAVYDRMNFLYGDRRPREDMSMLDELAPLLPIGSDDFSEFKTHQLRISNFLFLPREAIARLRVSLGEAQGIYLVGCRSAKQVDASSLSVAQAMADTIGRPVHGAAYYSKVFQRDDEGEWDLLDLSRADPPPDLTANPVVLVPGAKGGGQFLAYLWKHHALPPDLVAPQGDNLLAVYDQTLTRCDPASDGDSEGATP